MKTFWIRSLFALAAFVFVAAATNLFAGDLGAVKQRMAQRLAAIDTLKDRGVVGENNRGYLEAKGALSGDENQMMAGENSDRSTVYAALAQQTGSSSDQVGRARAKQIAQNSKAGVWLQDESGRWYRK
jgi:uncharacterized protein YdbL (DUF1318 family)